MSKKIIQKVVLAAVIIHDSKVLLVQRNTTETTYPLLWELPSGKREVFEDSAESLVREVKEEADLEVTLIMPVSVFDYKVEKEKVIRDTTQINFLAKLKGKPEVTLSGEHQDFAWVSGADLGNYKVTNDVKKVIKQTFSLVKRLE